MDGLPKSSLSEERVRERAYEIYLERGESEGHALDDWLEAEIELEKPHDDEGSRRKKR
jgi:hypothetical protein